MIKFGNHQRKVDGLTPKQWEAVRLLVSGFSKVDIANHFGISVVTIKRWFERYPKMQENLEKTQREVMARFVEYQAIYQLTLWLKLAQSDEYKNSQINSHLKAKFKDPEVRKREKRIARSKVWRGQYFKGRK